MPRTTTVRRPTRGATKAPETVPVVENRPAVGPHDFAWYWRSYTVSVFGDQVTLVALPIAVFARTQSAFAVGIAASMQAATTLIFGLVAGALADRLRHRPVLIVTDVARAAVLGLLAVLVLNPHYPVGVVYLAAFLLGAFTVLHDAAAGAALPIIVSGRDLLRANGRLSGSEAVGNAGGPALAGALTSMSVGLAFAADAVTFVASALGITRIRAFRESAPAVTAETWSMGADIKEGLRALRQDTAVVKAIVLIACMNVMAVAVEAQFVPFARTVLHVGAVAIGVYFAIGGAAGVITAWALGRTQSTRGDAMILGVGIFAAGVLLAGLAPSVVALVFTYLAAGFGSVLAVSHWSSLRQRRFPVRLLGRVTMATRMAVFGVIPFAYIAGGLLARSEGSRALFVAAGAVGLAACAWAGLVGLGALRVDDRIAPET